MIAWRNRGLFVTGTDTGVGKTVACALLVRALGGDYWKPVQTGLAGDEGDSATVAHLAAVPPHRLHAPRYAFQAPLAPAAAAAAEGVGLALADFVLPETPRPLVVEGAGGVLVPLDGEYLMVDLMARLALPVVVVARSGLGTVNHTLLTLEALLARNIAVAGYVLSGPPHPPSRSALARHAPARLLAEIPAFAPLTAAAVADAAEGVARAFAAAGVVAPGP